MGIVRFAVRRPVTVAIIVCVVLVLGYVSFSRLGLDLYPDMKFPVGAVITSYSGAGPEEVESQISKPIESIMGTLANVEEIRSYSLAGQSIVVVLFNWGTDMDFATLNMREKLSLIERYLPSDADKPMVVRMDPSMMPVIQIGLSGGRDVGQLQELAEDDIKPALERIPGVASVTLTGGLTREVRIEVDPVKLQNYGLTMSQVVAVLRADNFNMSAGTTGNGSRSYFVRCLQEFESVDDIRNVTILTATGQGVRIGDIAEVTDGYADVEQYTRMNRKPSIGIHILKQSDANTVIVSRQVREELEKLRKTLPGNIEIGVVYDQADIINMSITNLERVMLEGALLAMLILFFFLRSIPSTLAIATSIPLSIVVTFVLMYFNNMTVNLLSLGGLALGIGRMVDDSIVVLESIFRHRQKGKTPLQAAIDGASEVGNAVMAATFTTVAVFLPIMFVEGLAAILFKPLALTVSFAILSSLAVALTVIPLLSSRMLVSEIVHEVHVEGRGLKTLPARFAQFIDSLGEWYRGVINWALGHRKTVVVTVIVLMIASGALVPLIGAEFLPSMDAGQISITIETDKGSKLEETDRVTRQVEKILAGIPETNYIFTSVGATGSMMSLSGGQDNATIRLMLKNKSERERSTTAIAEEIRRKLTAIPGARFKVTEANPMTQGMNTTSGIEIQIKGDDLDELRRLSNQVLNIVRSVPGTREANAALTEGKPEIQIIVDRDRAASYGLTPYQVASAVQASVQGTVATRYRVEGDEVDVRVRYKPAAREDITDIDRIMITTATGLQVPLKQLAAIKVATGPVSITRLDQVRTASVTAELSGERDLGSVVNDIKKRTDRLALPEGYSIEFTGQNEMMRESFQSLTFALLLAVFLVYAVMAIQYESFFVPFVIMFSVPTCFIGVVAGLALTGKPFSIPAFIGVIMLVGIAVSNAIVLVDYIKTLRERGMERDQAIAEAGAVRLRPVLMTALATILALLPLAFGRGEGGENQAPLAIVVVGGLLASTVITLVLVPVVYSIFDDWGKKIGAWLRRKDSEPLGVDINP